MRVLWGWFIFAHLCFAQTSPELLTVHVDRARTAQARQDFKTAAQEWEIVSKLAPNTAEVYSNLGMMYHFDQQYLRAISAFERATKLGPNLLAPELFLGIDYYLMSRSKAGLPHLEAARALAPNDALVLKWLAMTYYEAGDFRAALNQLSHARRVTPQDSDVLFYQSRAYTKLLFQSHEEIRRIDAQSPLLEALRNEKISVPTKDAAERMIQDSLKANRLTDAFVQSDRLVSRSPENAAHWYWFGQSSKALALELLDEFLQKQPDSYHSDQLKAEYALAIGDDDGAINEFRRSLSKRSNAPGLHESLGNIFMTRHDYAHAIPEYEAEIQINAYALVSLERAGRAYAELRDVKRAAEYLNRALSIDSRSFEALDALGKVDFERGDYVNAVKHYRLAIAVNEKDPAIFFQLSKAYKAMGDSAEATHWLARFRAALAAQRASEEGSLSPAIDAARQ